MIQKFKKYSLVLAEEYIVPCLIAVESKNNSIIIATWQKAQRIGFSCHYDIQVVSDGGNNYRRQGKASRGMQRGLSGQYGRDHRQLLLRDQ